MAYVTQQDLVDRFGATELIQLTDRTNRPATTIDPTVVERHIADAQSLVDGYVGKVYALPLASVPASLTKVAADLARYFLHGKAADKDGAVAQAYRDAIRWLQDVSRGLVVIEDAGTVPPVAGSGGVQATPTSKPLSVDSLKGYV